MRIGALALLLLGCARPPAPTPAPPPPRPPEVSKPLAAECALKLLDEQVILPNISFKSGSSELTESEKSCCTLRGVASYLAEHTDLTLVAIEVHSDERGPTDYNAQLSQKRANALVVELTALGVESSRLLAVGVGELCPLDRHSNEAAWAKNRRVLLNIIEIDHQTHGRTVSCNAQPVAMTTAAPATCGP